jgi:hypothetical protein
MDVMFNGAPPVFERVTVCVALLFTETLPKARAVGETLAAAAVPVPFTLMFWGLPGALSAICMSAPRVPCDCGENLTLMVQDPNAPSIVGTIGQSLI